MMSYIQRLFYWENTLVSGSVFAGGLLFLSSCLRWSFLSVTANVLLYLFLAGLASKLYVHLMGFMKKPCKDILTELQRIDLKEQDVEKVVSEAARNLKTIVEQARDLLLAHDIEKSAKFCLFLYLLTYLGIYNNNMVTFEILHQLLGTPCRYYMVIFGI